MPKKRQIPRLFDQQLADGRTVYHWKPSKSLRAAGFTNRKLGTNYAAAVAEAVQLNAQVAAWQSNSAAPAEEGAFRPPLPRVVRFAELVERYKGSEEWKQLRDSTQREYGSRLRQLEYWAGDGTLPVKDIDKQAVADLRKQLLKGSVYKCGAMLRVLRMVLNWAMGEGIVQSNATDAVKIPEPPARKVMMPSRIRDAISEAAIELGMRDVALAIELAFWTLQRQGDVLELGRMAWREVDNLQDVDPRHTAQLVDARGRVMGFRLRQQKTLTWIDAPMPPMLHEAVERAMRDAGNGYVFPHPERPEEPMPTWMFQRRFRAARDAAAAVAIMREDMALAEAIDAVQYRDLRRTGMTFYKSAGAKVPWITALSGHAVIGRKTILDTYMPGDTESAIACVATGLRKWSEASKREAVG